MIQRTLVLIKPDGVKRHLIGEILNRFEKAGLSIVELKMLTPSKQVLDKHYPNSDDYLISLGKKSAAAGDKIDNFLEQGRKIVNALRSFMGSGKMVAMVLEGEDSISLARKVTGYTDPSAAEKGTIRGDLGEDSILKANSQGRPVYNLVHASGNLEEATRELNLWFA